MRRLNLILPALAAALFAAPGAADDAPRPRLLFISLDAVPYAVVARVTDRTLGDEAAFPGFTRPAALISTFPSTTSLALAGILESFGLEKSPGYEHRFFDHEMNKKRGGGPISYRKLLFPWRKYFDWQVEGFAGKGIKILHLQKSCRKAIDRSLAAFAASDQDVFTIYHDITDLTGHVQGPDALEPFMRHLDAGLEDLRQRPGQRPFHTVIYSDHGLSGGEPLRNIRKGIKKTLRRAGFRIRGHIHEATDVVFIPYGLVSSLVAFTAPGSEVKAAEILATVEGVDLCVAADGDGWRITSRRGSARCSRRRAADGDHYAYQPLSGDPLGYAELAASDPWRSDGWWFEATRTSVYPDALHRIATGFELVENAASVICSVADGHMYGSAFTVLGSRISTGKLKWTHGALTSEASLGFVMSDVPGSPAPDVVRFDEALRPWAPAAPAREPED